MKIPNIIIIVAASFGYALSIFEYGVKSILLRVGTKQILALSLITGVIPAFAENPPVGYFLQWSDEFNGDVLNTNFWNIESGPRNLSINTAAAVSVTNGYLVLTTYTENKTNYTGFIDTKNKILNKYGYYEASIQFSNSPGNWSAFWLQSPYIHQTNSLNNSTNGVEIDIFEHRSVDKENNNWKNGGDHALHWNGYKVGFHKENDYFNRNLGIDSGFHTYGLLWTPDKYIFSVDGRTTWTTNYLVSSVAEFVLLTSEVQTGSWTGNVPQAGYLDHSHSNIKMLVDYVRYYAPPRQTAKSMANSNNWRRRGVE